MKLDAIICAQHVFVINAHNLYSICLTTIPTMFVTNAHNLYSICLTTIPWQSLLVNDFADFLDVRVQNSKLCSIIDGDIIIKGHNAALVFDGYNKSMQGKVFSTQAGGGGGGSHVSLYLVRVQRGSISIKGIRGLSVTNFLHHCVEGHNAAIVLDSCSIMSSLPREGGSHVSLYLVRVQRGYLYLG